MRIFVSKSEVKREFHSHLQDHFLNRPEVTLFYKNLVHEMKSANQLYNIKNLEKKLDKLDFALVILTKDYANDGWLQAELNCLFAIEQTRGNQFLIPVLADNLESKELPKYFNGDSSSFIDIRNMGEKDAADKVAAFISSMTISNKSIFIGHGRSSAWKELKEILQARLNLSCIEFNSEPQEGKSTKEVLLSMLENSKFAFLVMTPKDERPDKTFHARENVVHEVGLFQGKLGFEKAIILLEAGCEEFSNIHGLTQIRFSQGNLDAVYLKIEDVLSREGII